MLEKEKEDLEKENKALEKENEALRRKCAIKALDEHSVLWPPRRRLSKDAVDLWRTIINY